MFSRSTRSTFVAFSGECFRNMFIDELTPVYRDNDINCSQCMVAWLNCQK